MSITVHFQRIQVQFATLLEALRNVGELSVRLGHAINELSTLIDEDTSDQLGALCYDWSRVEFPKIPVGSRVRLDHGPHYTKFGTVTADRGPYCEIKVGEKTTQLGKRWLSVCSAASIAPEMTVHTHSTRPPQSDTMPCAPPTDHVSDTVPFAADFAPDAVPPESTTRAIESTAPKSGVRAKEALRTCVQWASDDYAWTNYVRSIQAQARDDHPAKKYTAVQLEELRAKFQMDPAVVADSMPYPRPGAKFTRWLEVQ